MFSNPRKVLGFDDRPLAIICIVINTHGVMAMYYTGAFFTTDLGPYLIKWLGEFFAVSLLWLVIRWLYIELVRKKSGLKNMRYRLLIIPLFLIPYFLISIWFIEYIQPYFDWVYAEYDDPPERVQITTGAIIFFIDMGLYEGLHLFVELKDTKLREEQLKKENVTAQLANLKNQISPHFLFNSLNTLVYLIDLDKEKGKDFVHKLSFIFEKMLESSEKDLIEIKEEMKFVNAYTDLLKHRFGDNLKINFEMSKEASTKKIIPMAMQVGIENAVKHNIISKQKPLTIDILSKDGYVLIKNNLQKKVMGETRNNGHGLNNISNRYKLLTNKLVGMEDGDSNFILKLPLL